MPCVNVVVVGDTKTPDYDALPVVQSLPNLHFLSYEEQESVGFRISRFVPSRHYARKNFGYLFAIQHGARIILDTDDDNMPFLDSIPGGFFGATPFLTLSDEISSDTESVVNPYAYFGQPSMWPRGLPLKSFELLSTVSSSWLCPCRENVFSPIQQFLQNGNPDVDAIFRLTHAEEVESSSLDYVTTGRSSHLSLPIGVLSPFNSQNTLFYDVAFWGLFIPVSVSFRTCDIWRGYWSQRILWEIGGALSFAHPTVDHIRNPHDVFLDFIDEKQLYDDGLRLTEFLIDWRYRESGSGSEKGLYPRIVALAEEMEEMLFWSELDSGAIRAWLQDLEAVGYSPPDDLLLAHDFPPALKLMRRPKKEWCDGDRFRIQQILSFLLAAVRVPSVHDGDLLNSWRNMASFVPFVHFYGDTISSGPDSTLIPSSFHRTLSDAVLRTSPKKGLLIVPYTSLPVSFESPFNYSKIYASCGVCPDESQTCSGLPVCSNACECDLESGVYVPLSVANSLVSLFDGDSSIPAECAIGVVAESLNICDAIESMTIFEMGKQRPVQNAFGLMDLSQSEDLGRASEEFFESSAVHLR